MFNLSITILLSRFVKLMFPMIVGFVPMPLRVFFALRRIPSALVIVIVPETWTIYGPGVALEAYLIRLGSSVTVTVGPPSPPEVPPFWLAQPSAEARTFDEKHRHKTKITPMNDVATPLPAAKSVLFIPTPHIRTK
jgi:hypothetical protein